MCVVIFIALGDMLKIFYQVQLIRIQLRVPEYGWTTQKLFHLMNFLVNGCKINFSYYASLYVSLTLVLLDMLTCIMLTFYWQYEQFCLDFIIVCFFWGPK